MNLEIKKILNDLIDYTSNAPDEYKIDSQLNIFQFGLVHFLLYVAGLDKKIENEEIKIIEYYSNYKIDKKKASTILKLISKENLKIPLLFNYYIILNKMMEKQNLIEENLALALLKAFKTIGYEIVRLRMNENLDVLNKYLSYENEIRQYIINKTKEIEHEDDTKKLLRDFNNKVKTINYNLKEYFNNVEIREKKLKNNKIEMVDNLKSVSKESKEKKKKEDKNLNKTNLNIEKDISDVKIEEIIKELNSYIGLKKVKKEINTLINLIKVRKKREELGLKNPDMSYHLCFLGNPGTGKTSVARILAKIYKELGILRIGQLVEVGRQDLVGGYVGQTAIKTKDVIEKAYGGILFIDEAYSLSNKGSDNDYGSEAIEVILKEMEDHRDDLIVIVAGYENEMKEFLKANPGLESRFNTFIDFEDYTTNELLEIIDSMCVKNDYVLEKKSRNELEEFLCDICQNKTKDFANARYARNLFEKAIKNQATRLFSSDDNDDYKTLKFSDFLSE